ncbi:MAG TPA: ABC transporter ATP-binding protein [Thermoanaerobaculia bacterium]|nr:ABC transporter ATP-binding protein [Thermoanaerobaculia bacterium]
MNGHGLVLQGVSFRYDATAPPVLDDIHFEVRRGELLAVVGASGSGKSSLLRLIAGLARPSSGTISFAGRVLNELEPGDRGVGMAFQDYALYPHLSVAENLMFPLRARGVGRLPALERAAEVARLLHIAELMHRKPRELSGGQRQRVALGRLLVRSPEISLFDEPLSNLDASLRRELRLEIRSLHQQSGWTTLYVTHDATEATALGERVLVLHRGRVVQIGSPRELREDPRHREVIALLSVEPMNFTRAAELPRAWFAFESLDTASLTNATELAIPAHSIGIASGAGSSIEATYLGGDEANPERSVVRVASGAHWTIQSAGDTVTGASIRIAPVRPADAWAFNEDGTRAGTVRLQVA